MSIDQINAFADKAPTPEMPAVAQNLQELQSRIHDLHEEIDSLMSRLEICTAPAEPTVSGDGSIKRRQQSNLAHLVQDLGESVHAATLKLNELKHRVDV